MSLQVILGAMICAAMITGFLRLRIARKELEAAHVAASADENGTAAASAGDLSGPDARHEVRTIGAAAGSAAPADGDRLGEGSAGHGGDPTATDARVRDLARQVSSERLRFYAPGEVALSEFASTVTATMRRHNLVLKRLAGSAHSLGAEARGSPAYSYAGSGSARDIAAFLSEVSRSRRIWNVPYLRLTSRAGRGDLDLEFQASPCVAGDDGTGGKTQSPDRPAAEPDHAAAHGSLVTPGGGSYFIPTDEVAMLFTRETTPRAPHGPPRVSVQAAPLRYVAFLAAGAGERSYVFKELATGRIIVISRTKPAAGFRLAELASDGFMLEKGGVRYLVSSRKASEQ